MIDFSKVTDWQRPRGKVLDVSANGVSLWGGMKKISVLSFGDSIAAGHKIDGNWETDYGWDAQYGVDGRKQTTLVPGCYTDILRQELESIYGKDRVSVTSFARSGDRVSDLITKLTHDRVKKAIKNADLVLVCIGANDVLHYALTNLEEYIATADSSKIDGYVTDSLNVLNTDSDPNSYISLFNRLHEINPNAKYVFTTVYNPYKHLWLEEGSGQGSFFYHILNLIPSMVIDVDEMVEDALGIDDLGIWNVAEWRWVSIELDLDIGQYVKDNLMNTNAIKTLFKSVNSIGTIAEGYIDGNDKFIGLNPILRNKINSFQAVNPNFVLAETKKLFDLFPSRTDTNDDVDYSDLVNVEFAKDCDFAEVDWGALWRDYSSPGEYVGQLYRKHYTFTNAVPSTNVWDYVSVDMEGIATDLVADIVAKVIEPDVDPHPKHQGHQVLKRSFSNMFGLVKYEPNGGGYVVGDVVPNGRTLTAPNAYRGGYKFGGWYTDTDLQNALNLGSTDFADYKASHTLSDLVSGNTVISKLPKVTPLYAKWYEVIRNMIPNGSFDSLDGWVANKVDAQYSVNDKTLMITANPTETKYIWMQTAKKLQLQSGHKYYSAVDCLKSGGGTTAWAMYDTTTSTSYWTNGIKNPTDNLLRYPNTFEGWTKATNITAQDGIITWSSVSSLGWNAITNRDASLKYSDIRDKEVTLSFEVRCDEYEALNSQSGNGLILNFALHRQGAPSRYRWHDVLYFDHSMSDNWERIEYTFTASDSVFSSGGGDTIPDTDTFVIGFYQYALQSLQIRNVKLEMTDKSDVRLSHYYTATANAEPHFLLYGITYDWAADFVVKWDNLLVVDLTEAFGAGNEPTAEWCDANIPYFTDTMPLYEELEYIESSGTQ